MQTWNLNKFWKPFRNHNVKSLPLLWKAIKSDSKISKRVQMHLQSPNQTICIQNIQTINYTFTNRSTETEKQKILFSHTRPFLYQSVIHNFGGKFLSEKTRGVLNLHYFSYYILEIENSERMIKLNSRNISSQEKRIICTSLENWNALQITISKTKRRNKNSSIN